jgi:hypothetical protein
MYVLVIHKNVTAFDISVQEVLSVTVGEAVEQLPHDGRVVRLREVHHLRFQQPHQIMVHVLEYQVERTLILKTDIDST